MFPHSFNVFFLLEILSLGCCLSVEYQFLTPPPSHTHGHNTDGHSNVDNNTLRVQEMVSLKTKRTPNYMRGYQNRKTEQHGEGRSTVLFQGVLDHLHIQNHKAEGNNIAKIFVLC